MCGTNNSGAIITEDDPSPPGVSLSPGSYMSVEPCDCVAERKCPWCSSPLVGDENDFDIDDCTLECSDGDCKWTWIKAVEYAQEPPSYEP